MTDKKPTTRKKPAPKPAPKPKPAPPAVHEELNPTPTAEEPKYHTKAIAGQPPEYTCRSCGVMFSGADREAMIKAHSGVCRVK